MKKLTKPFIGLFSVIVIAGCLYGQMLPGKAMLVTGDNEMACDKAKQDNNFYAYPVMLEGQILDYADFKLKGQGQLSIVSGGQAAAVVPFYIYLRRNGKIVTACKINALNQPVCSINIADVLSYSKVGDMLIIIPATMPCGKAKIMLKEMC
jgi:hypothetical protein